MPAAACSRPTPRQRGPHVVVPVAAVLSGGVRVGTDQHELRVARDARGRRVDVQRSEAPPEGEALLVADVLVVEEDDPVLDDQGAADLLERLVERAVMVDPETSPPLVGVSSARCFTA